MLTSNRWEDDTDPETRTTENMFRGDALLVIALRAATKLERLHLGFLPGFFDPPGYLLFELPGFTNLTSLEIYNCHGPEGYLLKQLSICLSALSNLKVIGLSLATPDDNLVPTLDGENGFLEKLCIAYHSLKVKSLNLRTLKLGHGLSPVRSRQTDQLYGDYVNGLVNLRDIRTLHLFNGRVHLRDDEDVVLQDLPVDWGLFKNCKSLIQVSLSQLDDSAGKWLNDKVPTVCEIFLLRRCMTFLILNLLTF
jgi:hypothetical protein